jgi:hypothetical protein
MIIFWRGCGCAVILLPVLLLALMGYIWELKEPPSKWIIGIVLVPNGVVLWWWGRWLNRPLDRGGEAQGETPGAVQDTEFVARHSLYGIRMELWGIFYVSVGLVLSIGGFLIHK